MHVTWKQSCITLLPSGLDTACIGCCRANKNQLVRHDLPLFDLYSRSYNCESANSLMSRHDILGFAL
jgi:hypothetical protein